MLYKQTAYKHPDPPWPAFSSSHLEREVSARLIIPIINGWLCNQPLGASHLMTSLSYRWANVDLHLASSTEVSLQRDLPLVPVYLLQVTTSCPQGDWKNIMRHGYTVLRFSRKDPNVKLEADGELKQKDDFKNIQVNQIKTKAHAGEKVQVKSIRSISTNIQEYKTEQSTKQMNSGE